MHNLPKHIDGAAVLEWAWSGVQPFGRVCADDGSTEIEVFGLALCCYLNDSKVYRFSCDAMWEAVQDFCYGSIAEAKAALPVQYRMVDINWKKYD